LNRRQLIRAAGAAAFLLPVPGIFGRAAAQPVSRVRPGDPAWPSAALWDQLKRNVGGRLIEIRSPFGVCRDDPVGLPCDELFGELKNPYYVGDNPALNQTAGWVDAWTAQPSVYAVAAETAADVAAAVNFARDNNLRLVVKGGSHSYLGTSNAPDSLLVWTRRMNTITPHDSFTPQGCAAALPAVSVGAGAVWMHVYNEVTTRNGRYVQGGGCLTVGVAGLVQGGGYGSFSRQYGTAAASLLEAEIVTADGAVRIANACSEPELFFALKGGGGGTFGVVTRLTLRTHALPEFFGGAFGVIKARSDAAFRQLIAEFVAFYASSLKNPHWGEQVAVREDNSLKISMVCQGLKDEDVKALWKPFVDQHSSGNYEVSERLRSGARSARHWWELEGNPAMIRDERPGAPSHHGWWQGDQDQVDAYLHGYESLWLPESLLAPAAQARLADALFAASRHKEVGLHFNKGLAGAPAEAIAATLDTATNPKVTQAFALAIIADGEAGTPFEIPAGGARALRIAHPKNPAAAEKDARDIDLAAGELFKAAPNAASYVSESNYFNARWAEAYWGSNYPRLKAAKKKYDPEGLFFVHHGIGSEEWSADGFTRLA
jgi:FAD/FMN-containing dehydrogenase